MDQHKDWKGKGVAQTATKPSSSKVDKNPVVVVNISKQLEGNCKLIGDIGVHSTIEKKDNYNQAMKGQDSAHINDELDDGYASCEEVDLIFDISEIMEQIFYSNPMSILCSLGYLRFSKECFVWINLSELQILALSLSTVPKMVIGKSLGVKFRIPVSVETMPLLRSTDLMINDVDSDRVSESREALEFDDNDESRTKVLNEDIVG
ncbi:hypothetical protein COLO4_14027 [Corchorus olitorius]|uniref:Uncharacterized protein n=1 Tax=Corchorus olitorius TaxID=93759 RepID=A0A1R3JTT0_9ROSI|nr:hypothetical protein COLO4_14027 [Corchorus olitorius]